MALSMDEQRALAEIERRLAADDPGLATCLTAFRRPGPATVLRSPRARIIGSLFTVLLVAMVSLMVYAMIPFRAHGARTPVTPSAGTQSRVAISATGTGSQAQTPPPASANGSAKASARSATPSAGLSASSGHTQPAGAQTADRASPPTATGP
jgi:Protein of unknown function (DUF3040)